VEFSYNTIFNTEIVHCLFWPEGWSSPEPPIEYQFQIRNQKIISWEGKYRWGRNRFKSPGYIATDKQANPIVAKIPYRRVGCAHQI
jgi:hypothetical protein